MRYALIKNNIVDNVIIADYRSAHEIKKALGYDDAVCVDNYPVGVGASYENGEFLTGEDLLAPDGTILIPKGTVIERNLTQEEVFQIAQDEQAQSSIDLDFRLSMIELGL